MVTIDPADVGQRMGATVAIERDGDALMLTAPGGTLHVDGPARVVAAEPVVASTPEACWH